MLLNAILSQVAAEYGALAAKDAFRSLQYTLSSLGTEVWVIAAAVVVGLYLLVKLL